LPGWHRRVVTWTGTWPSAGDFARATAVILWHRRPDSLCERALAACPRLDWVHSLWTGLEHLPITALLERGVSVTSGRGTVSGPLSEWAVMAVLWGIHAVPVTQRKWGSRRWEPTSHRDLRSATIVVAGLGSVGGAIARSLRRLGGRVVGVRRRARPSASCTAVVPLSGLPEACRSAAALVVALPSSASTRGAIGAPVLAALPDGAVVVIVGRGSTVDEDALLREVASGRLVAAVDAWWEEPLPPSSPWWDLSGVLPSPHSAAITPELRERQASRAAQNVERYLTGRTLVAAVGRRDLAEMAVRSQAR
jgi:phosphoglycerate dehydrogenase-like enzyme